MEASKTRATASVNASEDAKGTPPDNKVGVDGSSLLEKQTRTRRLFSYSQLFSFSLVYLGTWYCTAM